MPPLCTRKSRTSVSSPPPHRRLHRPPTELFITPSRSSETSFAYAISEFRRTDPKPPIFARIIMATTLVHDITTVQPAPSSSSPMAALSSFLSTRQRQLHSAHHTPLNDAIPHVSHSLDTSTLAAADYDVDIRTGFMPPTPPVARLPAEFEVWESTLEEACGRLKLGQDTPSDEELELSEKWRSRTRQVGSCFSRDRHALPL